MVRVPEPVARVRAREQRDDREETRADEEPVADEGDGEEERVREGVEEQGAAWSPVS